MWEWVRIVVLYCSATSCACIWWKATTTTRTAAGSQCTTTTTSTTQSSSKQPRTSTTAATSCTSCRPSSSTECCTPSTRPPSTSTPWATTTPSRTYKGRDSITRVTSTACCWADWWTWCTSEGHTERNAAETCNYALFCLHTVVKLIILFLLAIGAFFFFSYACHLP